MSKGMKGAGPLRAMMTSSPRRGILAREVTLENNEEGRGRLEEKEKKGWAAVT